MFIFIRESEAFPHQSLRCPAVVAACKHGPGAIFIGRIHRQHAFQETSLTSHSLTPLLMANCNSAVHWTSDIDVPEASRTHDHDHERFSLPSAGCRPQAAQHHSLHQLHRCHFEFSDAGLEVVEAAPSISPAALDQILFIRSWEQ